LLDKGLLVLILLGFLVVLASVFGSYTFLGGHLGALYQPFEFVLIAGSALGAYLASNSGKSMGLLLRAIPTALRRSPYDKPLYMELMALLYVLLNKARRDGLMSVESDIEDPSASPLFAEYPRVVRNARLMEFITDYLRLIISGNMSAFEIETLMDQEIETLRKELHIPVHGLRAVADALPAFGIVAAVLGVIKALAAVDQPPAILADLISKAMVGTFLGILLAYGFVAPMASTIERRNAGAEKVLECVKLTLLASMNGYPPQLAVEFGRKALYSTVRPSFVELEEHVRQTRSLAGKKA
jgi:chemotaxis protein MotA